MKLIVGMGNPDDKYQYSRHNIGYMVVEKLAKQLLPVERSKKGWEGNKKFTAEICKINQDLILAKPHTYMNRSGIAIQSLVNFYKIKTEDLWIIHDDIDLPLGKIRIRQGGSSGGHNGVESIIKNLPSEDFIRFRLGIEKFVLSPFKDHEGGDAKKMIKNAVKAIMVILDEGLEKAMNRYN